MTRRFLARLKIDSTDFSQRRLVSAKASIILSFALTFLFTLYNYFGDNALIFKIDLGLLVTLTLSVFIFARQSVYVIAAATLAVMGPGLLLLIYLSQGEDNVVLWSIVFLFYGTYCFGHNKGTLLAALFFAIVIAMMSTWVDVSISSLGYSRFIAVVIVLTVIAHGYERSIHHTLLKLEAANKALAELSKNDSLTGLYNRRFFDEQFPDQIKIARRNDKQLVLLIADVDFFKRFNDTYGHQAGDNILKKIAASFQQTVSRPDDFVFRLGGEEFGILWNTKTHANAMSLAHKIKDNIEHLKIDLNNDSIHPYLTISLGLYIVSPDDFTSCDEIYRRCDNALYLAKRKGRNTIEVAQKGSGQAEPQAS